MPNLSLLKEPFHAVNDFDVDNTGATNCTNRLKRFFKACIKRGADGRIPAGDYLVTEGELYFSLPEGGAWPNIKTAGAATRFILSNTVDAPLFTIAGGDNYFAGNAVKGGHWGGFTVIGAATSGTNQHAVSLTTVAGMHFDFIEAEYLNGAVVYIPLATDTGLVTGNPDYRNVTQCTFGRLKGIRCHDYILRNENGNGFNLSKIGCLNSHDGKGVYSGGGAGINIDFLGAGATTDYAIYLPKAHPGSTNRIMINVAEIDTCKYGIKCVNGFDIHIKQTNIIHRYLKNLGVYWPLESVSIGDETISSTLSDLELDVYQVIAAGGTRADLGVYQINFNYTAQHLRGSVRAIIRDDAGFGFDDTDLYKNLPDNADVVIHNGTRVIRRSLFQREFYVFCNPHIALPNTGFASTASRLIFNTKYFDRLSDYDTATGYYTIKNPGIYYFNAMITCGPASGSMLYLGLFIDRSGTIIFLSANRMISNDTLFQTIKTDALGVICLEGDKVFVSAQVPGPVNTSSQFHNKSANYFTGKQR